MGKQQKLKEMRREMRTEEGSKRSLPLSYVVAALLVAGAGIVGWNLLERNSSPTDGVTPEVSVVSSSDGEAAIMHTTKATIKTAKGDIILDLYPDAAPKTVENFVKLAKEGFYDGTKFHRVISDFVIQGGDPNSKDDDPSNDGQGGPGYKFEDEINPKSLGLTDAQIAQLVGQGFTYNYDLSSLPVDTEYLVMANSGPDTNGSQFFIVTGPAQKHLYGKHTAFGKVVEGFDVALKVQQGDEIEKIVVE